MSYLLNINLQMPNGDFSGKTAFESALLFVRDIVFSELVIFPCFRPNPYTRMGVLSVRSFNLFCGNVGNHCKTQFDFWFWGLL